MALSFHAESVILLATHRKRQLDDSISGKAAAASATADYVKDIFPSFNFGIHGIMVLPYLCGLCQSLAAYEQFRALHGLLSAAAASSKEGAFF